MKKIIQKTVSFILLLGIMPLQAVTTYELLTCLKRKTWDTARETVKKHPYLAIAGGIGTLGLIFSVIKIMNIFENVRRNVNDIQRGDSIRLLNFDFHKKQLYNLFPKTYKNQLDDFFQNSGKNFVTFTLLNDNVDKKIKNIELSDYVPFFGHTVKTMRQWEIELRKGYVLLYHNRNSSFQSYDFNDLFNEFAKKHNILTAIEKKDYKEETLREIFNEAQDKNIDFFEWVKNNPELFEKLTKEYKIHLMPQKDAIFKIAEKFIDAINKDEDLAKNINKFKIRSDTNNIKENGEVFPLIVIYPQSGNECAQIVLDKLYKLFKGQQGLDITPRYNQKITSLIYWAQGNGDHKGNKMNKEIIKNFYTEDQSCYKDFLGKNINYELKNPSEE